MQPPLFFLGLTMLWVQTLTAPLLSAAVLDTVLAEVGGTTITASDVGLSKRLGFFGLVPSGSRIAPIEIEQFIDARLVTLEAVGLGIQATVEEVKRHWQTIEREWNGASTFDAWLEENGIGRQWVGELIAQHLSWERFIELRFRSFVFITETEVLKFLGREPADPEQFEKTREALRSEQIGIKLSEWLREARGRVRVRRSTEVTKGVADPLSGHRGEFSPKQR